MEPFQCFSHFKCPTELEKQETATVLEINRPNNQNNSKSKRGRKKKKTNLKSLPCSDRHLSDGRLCQPTFQSSYSSEGKTHTPSHASSIFIGEHMFCPPPGTGKACHDFNLLLHIPCSLGTKLYHKAMAQFAHSLPHVWPS